MCNYANFACDAFVFGRYVRCTLPPPLYGLPVPYASLSRSLYPYWHRSCLIKSPAVRKRVAMPCRRLHVRSLEQYMHNVVNVCVMFVVCRTLGHTHTHDDSAGGHACACRRYAQALYIWSMVTFDLIRRTLHMCVCGTTVVAITDVDMHAYCLS